MLYWIVLILLIIGIAALLGGTFVTIKKNKAEDALLRRKKSRRRNEDDYDEDDYPDDDYDDEDDDYDERPRRRRTQRAAERDMDAPAPRVRQKRRRQWKIILEDIVSWDKYSFTFYDTVGNGRGKDGSMYEKYLPVAGDGRVSKIHCVIIRRGDKLYLKDEGSRNGTYLNGERLDGPAVIQRDDIIGVGETRFEVQRILRESE